MSERTLFNRRKVLKYYIPMTVVVLCVLVASGLWYKEYIKYISTDDAHIDSDNVAVSSKILGRITKVFAEEGDTVKEGMLLAELDSSDLQSQLNQTLSLKSQNESQTAQAVAKEKYDNENLRVLQVNIDKAKEDYDRIKIQFEGGVVAKEQFEHAQKALESAQAQLKVGMSQLDVSKAQIKSATASVETAKSQAEVVKTQLQHTKLYAPATGIVAKRWLLPGDIVQPGQSIYSMISTKKYWLIVYLEETYMSEVHPNQKVIYSIDTYPGVKFFGKVFSIGSNTASQFSLIPPNNASGNFTKVTQRVPVKVSIDGCDGGKQLSDYKFLSGMSAVVKIVRE